ncbi:uncharacterized protein WM294_002607 [Sarcoramphus papa]
MWGWSLKRERHLQLCLQAALRARQTPWCAQKSWRALRRNEGLQALARTRRKREAGREGRRGERRAKAAQKKRGGREKPFGGWSNEKMQEGAAGQEAQVLIDRWPLAEAL